MKNLRILTMVVLFLLLLCLNIFGAKKVTYHNLPDRLKDSLHAIGKVALISHLQILEELRLDRAYLGQREVGNKAIAATASSTFPSSQRASMLPGPVVASFERAASEPLRSSLPSEKRAELIPIGAPIVEEKKSALLEFSQSIKQVKKIAVTQKAQRTTEPLPSAHNTKTVNEHRGDWTGTIFFLLPLLIGAVMTGISYWTKTDLLINGVASFDSWIVNRHGALREQTGKGRIKRYWLMPILWILNGIIILSDKIQNKPVRCGVKTTAYLYLLGVIALVTFYAVALIIGVIICILILTIIGWILGWSEGKERTAGEAPRYRKTKERYKIVTKNGKEHLVEEGFLVDTDQGELRETWTGKLKTGKLFGKDYELEKDSGILSSDDRYKVKKSDGEEGILEKSKSLGVDLGDYEYKKKEDDEKK